MARRTRKGKRCIAVIDLEWAGADAGAVPNFDTATPDESHFRHCLHHRGQFGADILKSACVEVRHLNQWTTAVDVILEPVSYGWGGANDIRTRHAAHFVLHTLRGRLTTASAPFDAATMAQGKPNAPMAFRPYAAGKGFGTRFKVPRAESREAIRDRLIHMLAPTDNAARLLNHFRPY